MKTKIKERDDLASYPQISTMIYQMLTVAQAGGLTEERAEMIYNEIHRNFKNMQGAAFWPLRDDLIHILSTPDKAFKSQNGEDGHFNRWN
jgi:hypothetical protein